MFPVVLHDLCQAYHTQSCLSSLGGFSIFNQKMDIMQNKIFSGKTFIETIHRWERMIHDKNVNKKINKTKKHTHLQVFSLPWQ